MLHYRKVVKSSPLKETRQLHYRRVKSSPLLKGTRRLHYRKVVKSSPLKRTTGLHYRKVVKSSPLRKGRGSKTRTTRLLHSRKEGQDQAYELLEHTQQQEQEEQQDNYIRGRKFHSSLLSHFYGKQATKINYIREGGW